jgi:hypothetical protein
MLLFIHEWHWGLLVQCLANVMTFVAELNGRKMSFPLKDPIWALMSSSAGQTFRAGAMAKGNRLLLRISDETVSEFGNFCTPQRLQYERGKLFYAKTFHGAFSPSL